MRFLKSSLVSFLLFFGIGAEGFCQSTNPAVGKEQVGTEHVGREHLLMDFGWRFAFGHPFDPKQDFNNGTGYFSYFAKAGYGDGAAASKFNDSAWRPLDLPHDWAVEQPFDPRGGFSHGFKAVGRHFPNASVGWYRKTFNIPASDLGRRISIACDGVFRNSIVWVNGHYLGTEQSGYDGFEYDLTNYLNYGGKNVIAVRVDATMEEGWFYEGAGIYRHVWLNKTNALHVGSDGTFVTTQIKDDQAEVRARVVLSNDGMTVRTVGIQQTIEDEQGNVIATKALEPVGLAPFENKEVSCTMTLRDPKRWSVDTPYLHKLITILSDHGITIDRYETVFGIRSIRFDPDKGFFLNGKRLEIKGTNNHQDHAGVGTAMPDALQDFRIASLKAMGCNAYRCSHNPPTPELLDACDRLGMLVIDENRQMGTSAVHLNSLKNLILRDRNHPCVIAWSIGNEEWAIENKITGARIATTLQAYVKSIDSSRAITAAFSGGWGSGISAVMDLIGFNYIAQENPDGQHAKFPQQAGWGTEEGSTFATRGVYFNDSGRHQIAAYDKKPRPKSYSIEEGWNYYVQRPFLAGMFIWTGFDYRGEATPFGWPSTGSYFGMMDQCGFLKDDAWYLQSWWTDKTVLHLLPHWNWKGREGQPIDVWAYSNCDEVALFLNKKSIGRQRMPRNGHLEWKVNYQPGTLEAIGYSNGKKVADEHVSTTGEPIAVRLAANRNIYANKEDIAIITVDTRDKTGIRVPTADNEIRFSITGPGRIIGVGNGDPVSLEPDKYIRGDVWKRKLFNGLAQVIVQSTGEAGDIRLESSSEGLVTANLIIRALPAQPRPAVSEAQ